MRLVRGTSTFLLAKMVGRRSRQKDSIFDEADLRVKHFSFGRTNMEHILSSFLSKEKVSALTCDSIEKGLCPSTILKCLWF